MTKITLFVLGNGSSAALVNDDGDVVDIAQGRSMSARSACMKAAERLRLLAYRFDCLAHEDAPYQESVQNKINKIKVGVPAE